MKMPKVEYYVLELQNKFGTELAGEHAYRPGLKLLFELISGLNVINDPKRSEHGAPDFVFLKRKTTVAYAETKDVIVSLDQVAKSKQLERYYGYSNLILTNYLEFRFYRNGQPYGDPIRIGKIEAGKIIPLPENYGALEDALKDFLKQAREPITSGAVLSKVMAGKASRIRDNIRNYLKSGNEKENEDLLAIYKVIKHMLLAELDYDKFADMYAQTLVYGLFVARFYDKSQGTFSRQEARDLIPASNPFLRQFFDHIAGASFDKRLELIVNELCEEFSNTDVHAIVHNYYKTEKASSRDPIIHFYEDFLKHYDPKARVELGVFYTPLPVVDFIVRSIDEILKKEFNLKGLADPSKVAIVRKSQNNKYKDTVHKVQILDPATGTGTFLNEVIRKVKESFKGQEGRWSSYVREELLPRLHGFELMMAPYTIAHLKVTSILNETGAKIGDGRIGIYLTNALEKGEKGQQDLFSIGLPKAITEESRKAGFIKNELPIMVVLGNPPYSGESKNPFYTDNDVYKFEPGTSVKLKERNSKWINDDYVKFMRFAENLIEKTGEGVVGMITAHGYLDNPTFRGMRYHLMETFDSLYLFDLHGNANKKEVAPNGQPDKNVFDIKQGVAIILAIKKGGKKKKLAEVFRFDIQGSREEKFQFLNSNSFSKIQWKKVETVAPNYEFTFINRNLLKEYLKGFSVYELFVIKNTGVVTKRDNLCIQYSHEEMWKVVTDFIDLSEEEVRKKYELPHDVRDWKYEWAKEDLLKSGPKRENIIPIQYRPFDIRYMYYTGRSRGFVGWPVEKITKHFLAGKNYGLIATRLQKDHPGAFISKSIVGHKVFNAYDINSVFPLYIYEDNGKSRINFNDRIYKKISARIKACSPENILDYIYAVLHSQIYREKYNEFLKIDFPRVPYPQNEKQFFTLAEFGNELRQLHLLEHPKLYRFITSYPNSGSNEVVKVEYKDGKVYINNAQYFAGVSKEAWGFYIGGYQPAQKWLKDRKGRILSSEDIWHYQEIIVALNETEKIMRRIDLTNK